MYEKTKSTSEKIIHDLNWSGILMIEYLYDERDDLYKIIEINPRTWGSIMLAEFSDSQLLGNYFRLCLGEPINKSNAASLTYIRWFFPFDLLLYIKSGFSIQGFWNFRKPDTCYITFTYSTPFRSAAFIITNLLSLQSIFRFLKKVWSH